HHASRQLLTSHHLRPRKLLLERLGRRTVLSQAIEQSLKSLQILLRNDDRRCTGHGVWLAPGKTGLRKRRNPARRRGFYELRSDPITADQISKWATHRGRSAPQRRGSEVFEIQRFTALFLGHPGEQFAQPLVVGVADPQRAGLVVIEMETTRASRDPELAKRRLATEDQLRAVFETHGQHSAGVVHIDV